VPDHLLATVTKASEARSLQMQTQRLNLELRTSTPVLRKRGTETLATARTAFDFDSLVRASSSPLNAVCEMASRIARYDLSVLVTGESGTGKELLARAMHYASPRCGRAFVMENCAAMTDTLLESELFGHKRGSFTGAFEDHTGLFQRADGGTIFLDEIGDTSPAFQVKLLRVLQEGEVRPVGATRPVLVNVRVIAATHRDLEQDVRSGRFREDLYYRIAGSTLCVPPLRERSADILPIADMLLARAARELDRPQVCFAKDVQANLLAYPWPGNIRELKNEIYRAVALSDGQVVAASTFSQRVLYGPSGINSPSNNGQLSLPQSGSLQERIDAMEAVILRETMLRLHWNKTHAAKELGLSRVGLRQKLARFGLEGQADV
jgi:two-component system response regulator HupR/HoxA